MEKPINLDLENDLMNQEVGKHFFRQMAGTEAAEQIIKMRKKRFMRQVDLAKATGMTQSAISRIEQADYASWGFQTYLTVAEGLKAIVHISLEPIEDFLERHKAQDHSGFNTIVTVASVFEHSPLSENSQQSLPGECSIRSAIREQSGGTAAQANADVKPPIAIQERINRGYRERESPLLMAMGA